MGKIDPKDIYVAKDGTVYRVAEDGSLIKLKDGPGSGEPQKAQEPYKPKQPEKVTEGYWKPKQPQHEPAEYYQETPPPPRKKKHIGLWVSFVILVIGAITPFIIREVRNSSYDSSKWDTDSCDPAITAEAVAAPDIETAPVIENTPAVEEAAASNDDGSDFVNNGRFYGSVGGSNIHGYINFAACNADGWYYYDKSGSDNKMSLYFDTKQGDAFVWQEYYGDTFTGTWTLYLDYAYDNFANGTFVRASDGKKFVIHLYKSN